MEYTLTIEQTGGNAMVVPGRGFLLNNELTDFNFTPDAGHRGRSEPAGARQAAAQLDVTDDRARRTASRSWPLGSPGGSTIITTVLQILVNRIDLGMTLPEALAAPRATQRNTAAVQAEPAFLEPPEAAGLTALGHTFTPQSRDRGGDRHRVPARRRLLAAAEPVRRGGGAAAVVRPTG